MAALKGCVIAESLVDPTMINGLATYHAAVSPDGLPLDRDGGMGRWHLYWFRCAPDVVPAVQQQLKQGWYAHFWDGPCIIVVYADAIFEIRADDRSTWADAVAPGRRHGIPDEQLDFLTE
jgi:hypothetical protein